MIDGVDLSRKLKQRITMRYVRTLDKLDPQFARHILSAQREFFLAGKTFFQSEAGYAQKAIERIERKAGTGGG